MIAALFVMPDGVYSGLPDVDPWDVARDARLYAGPHAVVAHPPCERWGKYWHGGPNSLKYPCQRRHRGDDAGCFAAALWAVRTFGGVLEHPQASSAWRWFGLLEPAHSGGWTTADLFGGWTCCVEQGHYGHRARKATWLYTCGVRSLPSLKWGPSAARVRLDDGFHSAAEREMFRRPPAGMTQEQRDARRRWMERRSEATGKEWCAPERMGTVERLSTPPHFRDLLLEIARSVRE